MNDSYCDRSCHEFALPPYLVWDYNICTQPIGATQITKGEAGPGSIVKNAVSLDVVLPTLSCRPMQRCPPLPGQV
jgi:hypothetical protein